MKTLLRTADYRDTLTFELEQSLVFQNTWQLAGFLRDLAKDGDYVVAEAGGKSVIIRNFAGTLSAFLNVCSHRFSAIRPDCKGNGPLQCQYHGWVFDKTGLPIGIANIAEFEPITDTRRAELRLEQWEVETCGELVFVRKSTPGVPDLSAQLGEVLPVVEVISSSLGEQIDCNRMVIGANWKVCVENTLESYHVRSVHPETFARLNARTVEFGSHPIHTSWTADLEAVTMKQLATVKRMLRLDSPFKGYFHQLLFPAITLATTAGLTYSIQTFRPLSPETTEFTSYLFAAKHEGTASQQQILLEAGKPASGFNRLVFEEDRVVCEQVQRGIQQANPTRIGELSREERRVADFQRAWLEQIGWLNGPNACV